MTTTSLPPIESSEFHSDSRSSKAPESAQEADREDTERQHAVMHASDKVMELHRNRFISYALYYEWERHIEWRNSHTPIRCEPSLSVCVQMLRSVRLLKRIKSGILIDNLADVRMSSSEYFSALNSIQESISALEETNEPYILLTHIHDQYNVGFHFGQMTAEEAVIKMVEGVGRTLSYCLDPNRMIMGGDEGVEIGCLDCRDADNGFCDACYEKYM